MLRTRRGEREPMGSAVEVLYAEHCVRAVRLAYLLTGDPGAAEELAHEAFVRIWRSRDAIRSADALPAYLRKTVVSLSRTFLRRKALELRHRFRTAEDGVEIDVPERIDVLGAVARLPYGQRACIGLRFYEDLTEADTAKVLNVTVGTVKSQTHKALRRLEELMGGDRGAE